MKFHEVADIFPMMSSEEYESLKTDIKQNGLLQPIWTHEDQIIDGRNRFVIDDGFRVTFLSSGPSFYPKSLRRLNLQNLH